MNLKNKMIKSFAKKEVIICGGAYNTPQILLLSGVGPEAELKKHKIDIVHPLEGVGKHLLDHVMVPVAHTISLPGLETEDTFWNQLIWFLFRTGPLTSNVGEISSWVKTDSSEPKPNIQLMGHPNILANENFFGSQGDGISYGVTLLYPESSGEVTLNTTNFKDAPLINHNYLNTKKDIDALLKGIKIARSYFAAEPIHKFLINETHPGVNVTTDEDIIVFIRKSGQTLYHPTSTCKMGPITDKMNVVDARLKVHGMKGLRIVDASIFPSPIGSNTHAAVMMCAEKGADMILQDYKK